MAIGGENVMAFFWPYTTDYLERKKLNYAVFPLRAF